MQINFKFPVPSYKHPMCANRRCTGHANMSTERGNDRLITEYNTKTCEPSKGHMMHWMPDSGKRGRETIMANV